MTCEFCIQEVQADGTPEVNDDGTQYTWCPIDCLPIKGRVQRMVYSACHMDIPLPKVYASVKREDPTVADSNISRAIKTLKAKSYLVEGSDAGRRILCTATALKNGDADSGCYVGDAALTLTTEELRHLIYWHVAEKQDAGKWVQIKDSELVEIAGRFIDSTDPAGFGVGFVFQIMEPLVKKVRYVMSEFQRRSFPLTDALAQVAGIEEWEDRRFKFVKKLDRGNGWKVWTPYFREMWGQAIVSGEVSDTVRALVAGGHIDA